MKQFKALVVLASLLVSSQAGAMYFDVESGLDSNGFREYRPPDGRYTQFDPVGLRGGPNGYLYATANPLSFVDPTGLSPLGDAGAFVGAWGGRAAGAAGGELIFPPGGGVIGGLLGGRAGALGGRAAGEWINGLVYTQPQTPTSGEPGSCHVNPGSGQERKYGADGRPEYDIDWHADHGVGTPHGHNWDPSPDGGKSLGARGPGVSLSPWPSGRGRGE